MRVSDQIHVRVIAMIRDDRVDNPIRRPRVRVHVAYSSVLGFRRVIEDEIYENK
jgi:hypothetical protein